MRPGWQVKDTSVTAGMTPRFLSLKALVSWCATIMGTGRQSATTGERQGQIQARGHGDADGCAVGSREGGADRNTEGDTDREGHGGFGGAIGIHGEIPHRLMRSR